MQTFADIIDLWNSSEALAAEVTGAGPRKVTGFAVRKWRSRNRIPGEYWAAVVKAAHARGLDVSYEALAQIAERPQTESAA